MTKTVDAVALALAVAVQKSGSQPFLIDLPGLKWYAKRTVIRRSFVRPLRKTIRRRFNISMTRLEKDVFVLLPICSLQTLPKIKVECANDFVYPFIGNF